MKQSVNTLFSVILTSLLVSMAAATELSVMSYNIRLNIESDGENQWSLRKEFWLDQVGFHHPDFMGVQEAKPDQMRDIETGLQGYGFVGVGRDDGANSGEYSAIFYDAARWQVLTSSTFWLSETPEVPSKSWDAAYPRVCTYGKFKEVESGREIWVFNTHLDHVGEIARLKGVTLILDQIETLTEEDAIVFVTGDLNALPDSVPVKTILRTEGFEDARVACEGPVLGPKATFNGFQYDVPAESRIDYIFFRDLENYLKVKAYATLTDSMDARFPSDHFAVIAKCEF